MLNSLLDSRLLIEPVLARRRKLLKLVCFSNEPEAMSLLSPDSFDTKLDLVDSFLCKLDLIDSLGERGFTMSSTSLSDTSWTLLLDLFDLGFFSSFPRDDFLMTSYSFSRF